MSKVKNTLTSIAANTFSKYGFHKTSMDDIAKRAHKSKGSLYYYFDSKELLFKEVIASELNFLKEELLVIFNCPDTDSRVIMDAYMLRRMQILKISINYQETLRPEFYDYYTFLDDLITEMELWERNHVVTILNQGIEKGEMELPGGATVYAEVLVLLLKGLEHPFFLKGEYEKVESHLGNLIKVITRGMSK